MSMLAEVTNRGGDMQVPTQEDVRKQRRGVQLISLYIDTQHAKGLLNDVSHGEIGLGSRRIVYETYMRTHIEIILIEVERLVAEYRLRLKEMVWACDATGSWRAPTIKPEISDYVGVRLYVHPTITWTQIHERIAD